MACEPLGINYLGQKKLLLKNIIWSLVNHKSAVPNKFDKLAIAIF